MGEKEYTFVEEGFLRDKSTKLSLSSSSGFVSFIRAPFKKTTCSKLQLQIENNPWLKNALSTALKITLTKAKQG